MLFSLGISRLPPWMPFNAASNARLYLNLRLLATENIVYGLPYILTYKRGMSQGQASNILMYINFNFISRASVHMKRYMWGISIPNRSIIFSVSIHTSILNWRQTLSELFQMPFEWEVDSISHSHQMYVCTGLSCADLLGTAGSITLILLSHLARHLIWSWECCGYSEEQAS